jgi:hypothetical protein
VKHGYKNVPEAQGFVTLFYVENRNILAALAAFIVNHEGHEEHEGWRRSGTDCSCDGPPFPRNRTALSISVSASECSKDEGPADVKPSFTARPRQDRRGKCICQSRS